MGMYAKAVLLYRKAFWREKGFCGEVINNEKRNLLTTTPGR